jgi:hypothetical protein
MGQTLAQAPHRTQRSAWEKTGSSASADLPLSRKTMCMFFFPDGEAADGTAPVIQVT